MHPSARPSSRPLSVPVGWVVVALVALLAALLAVRGGTLTPTTELGAGVLRTSASTTAAGVSSMSPMSSSSGSTAAVPASSTGSTAAASSKKVAVQIKDYAFSPSSLTVAAGDTVTWTNLDSAPHTVTSSKGPAKLDSPSLAKGESWSFTFTKAGSYSYYCAVHPDMVAGVTVTGAAGGGMDHGGSAPAPAPSGDACTTGLAAGTIDKAWKHISLAHLQTSPGQQVSDLLNVDAYAKTHTVWLDSMLTPAVAEAVAGSSGMDPLMSHLQKAHLQTSPGQQVTDLLDTDSYVKAHTVLVDTMLAPASEGLTGSC